MKCLLWRNVTYFAKERSKVGYFEEGGNEFGHNHTWETEAKLEKTICHVSKDLTKGFQIPADSTPCKNSHQQ